MSFYFSGYVEFSFKVSTADSELGSSMMYCISTESDGISLTFDYRGYFRVVRLVNVILIYAKIRIKSTAY